MGTPEFAVPSLRRLIADGHNVAAVFSQPDKPSGRGKAVHEPPVKTLAIEHGIRCLQPAKIKTNEEVREVFQAIKPDACIVAAYGKILPPWLLEIPRLGCINVHASLLPKYRGAAPINWAIVNGETTTGVTIMQMDPGMDTGPMWSQRSIDIGTEETAPELSPRLAAVGADLLADTLPVIASGQHHPAAQNSDEATYAPILKKEDGLIDWDLPAKAIAARVRGFQPWPGSYTMFRGSRLIMWDATVAQANTDSETAGSSVARTPSTILAVHKAGFVVSCGEGTALRISEIQIEGKKRVPARDFLNGTRLFVGDPISQ